VERLFLALACCALAACSRMADSAETARTVTAACQGDSTVAEYSSPPVLLDAEAARASLAAAYPRGEVADGTAGSASISFMVDTLGMVAATSVAGTSGVTALDTAALRAVTTFRFAPAFLGRSPVCVWMTLPFRIAPPAG